MPSWVLITQSCLILAAWRPLRSWCKEAKIIYPRVPALVTELDFSGVDEFWRTVGSNPAELFYQWDNFEDKSRTNYRRITIFAAKPCLEILSYSRQLYPDGIFGMAGKPFSHRNGQLYCIRAPLGTTSVSCAYIHMNGKDEAMYTDALGALDSLCASLIELLLPLSKCSWILSLPPQTQLLPPGAMTCRLHGVSFIFAKVLGEIFKTLV